MTFDHLPLIPKVSIVVLNWNGLTVKQHINKQIGDSIVTLYLANPPHVA